jgi:hypothetical protein
LKRKIKTFKFIKPNSIEIKIKNRNSWTFTIAALVLTGTICNLLISGKVNIDSATLLSLILAFFSIYLSAQFYFKATEQSNDFYDRSQNHTKDIQFLLAAMDGKFHKSLLLLEKGNDSILQKVEGMNLGTFEKYNEDLRKIDNKIMDVVKNNILPQVQGKDFDKQHFVDEIEDLEKQKEIAFNKVNEEVILNILKTHVNSNSVKKYFNKKANNWGPGELHEIIYKIGPENILNMSPKSLQVILTKHFAPQFKNSSKEVKDAVNKIGLYDSELNQIKMEWVEKIIEESKNHLY